jgi:peptidoglycan/xylan/chitin deacetylase (PgdA/CDA1 family)
MSINRRILLVIFVLGLSMPLGGCFASTNVNLSTIAPSVSPTESFTATVSPTPFLAVTNTPVIIPPSYTPTLTFTPTPTDTPIPTNTPTPTDTPIPTNTPAYISNPPGHVTAPILLYHHVSDTGVGNRYYVSLDDFRAQMQALRDWGYTSITVSDLVNVLINGGDLPTRPVVITFDDGNVDIYQNAFPIMHEMGFVGTTYIVANRLQSNYFVNVEQIKEMANDGWEIGSHSMTHTDLTTDYSIARFEILQSRLTLEDAIGTPVNTFAYPYGKTDEFITNKVSDYGYRAGMGLGSSYEHTLGTLFYLSRIEVQGNYSFSKFTSLLPWTN